MNRNPYPTQSRTGACLTDHGPAPYVLNVNAAARQNSAYRVAVWTGCHLQMTLMSIPVNDEIGLEVHPETDQYLRVEEGQGMVAMGSSRDRLNERWCVTQNAGVFVPAGTWHNIVNTGSGPLKLSSVYAPPHHPHGTLQETKQAADADEH